MIRGPIRIRKMYEMEVTELLEPSTHDTNINPDKNVHFFDSELFNSLFTSQYTDLYLPRS